MFQYKKISLLAIFSFMPFSLVFAQSTFPEPKAWVNSQGTQVRYLYAPELDIVDIQIVFSAGSARDQGAAGIASITNQLIAHGSAKLSEEELNHSMDALGVRWSLESLRDMAVLSLRSLNDSEHLDVMVENIALILSQPSFPQKGLERIINSRTAELRGLMSRASHILNETWWQMLYQNHPYSFSPYGTIDSLKKIRREDIVAFHKQYYVANNMTIAIVGNLGEDEAKDIANRLSKRLPKGERAVKLPQPTPIKAMEKAIKIDAQQAHIRIGSLGVSRSADLRRYTALYLANYLLGGNGLVSDLGIEVREKRGLAYSIYSRFIPMVVKGPFSISLQTRNSKEKEAVQVVRDTLSQFIETIDEKRVNSARESIIGKFTLGVDSNKEMVSYLALMGFYHLPNSYLNDFIKEIKKLDAAFVQETFKNYLAENPLLLVSVGNGI